jgi:hypothetical protein
MMRKDMKKIYSSALLLLFGAVVLTSCKDDRDSNPTLTQPTEFSITGSNATAATVDLEQTKEFTVSWTLPTYTNFGASVIPTYIVQVSPTGTFTKEFKDDAEDNTGADYITLEYTFNSNKGAVSCNALDGALMKLMAWKELAAAPAKMDVTLRAIASVRDAGQHIYNSITSSNTIKITVAPYFMVDPVPVLWYMVGQNIGSADWSNSATDLGKGLIPLLPLVKEEYEKPSGTGVISYTGFFKAGTIFKFVAVIGNWDTQMKYENVESPDASFLKENEHDKGNCNIEITKSGYYTIKMHTKKETITIEPYEYEVAPKVFTSMSLPGAFNGWDLAANPVTACETHNGENHIWMTTIDLAEDTELKFAADGAWNDNWGPADGSAKTFPYGEGVNNGANIPVKAGSYTVFLNDITGQYMFISNETEE